MNGLAQNSSTIAPVKNKQMINKLKLSLTIKLVQVFVDDTLVTCPRLQPWHTTVHYCRQVVPLWLSCLDIWHSVHQGSQVHAQKSQQIDPCTMQCQQKEETNHSHAA